MALTLAATAVQAQPRISYIIPDIGTTRFATYVEFIGPYNTTSNFGTDGFYSNNPSGSAVRVRPARVADSVYVKIGPCVVSWNGRMVSTHIFVTPAAAPNSDVWSLLNAQWRIPLIVEVNGVASAADTFYIVRPFAFGDRRTDTKRILGDGQLGLRSRRGAMIVDSMVLAGGGLYTVSTADCDLGTPGNQGYLPLVLITAKSVTGGSGAKIILSGNGADAGPGGGGGGGGYANKPFFGSGTKRGTPGGAGFTGGGPGGYNDNSGDGSKQAPGAGTGDVLLASSTNVDGSKSLNGTPGGESFFRIWENAGGGTGHPFGRSGMGCAGTSSCVPIPGHGGGSGYRNGDPGGGGGFFEDGAGGPLRGGLAHGNDVLVPLAGGSGGASGNPNSYDNTSGFGGGGGGALSFHAARIVNLDIEAHGATSNREDTKGGGGSGGGIIIGTRVNGGSSVFPQTNGLDDQPNFNRGGGGRKRYDTPISFTPAPPRGPYSDSLTAVLRTFSITGAGDGRPIEVWVRSESSTWTLNTTITAFSPSNSFINATITLPGTDSIFYVMYAQQSANPSGAQYSAIPSHVLSQSAWNILRIFGPTIIDAVQNVDLGVRRCPNSVLTKSITIYNRGESPLEVRTPTWLNSNGFRIVSPTVFPDTIKVRDSTTYVIEYSPLPGATGVINDVLVLSNNDPVSARSPYRINVTATVERIELNYTYKGEVRDTIDLGAVCLGSVISEIVTITNIGTTSTTVTSVRSLNPSVVNATTSVPALLAVGGTTTIQLGGSLRAVGASIVPIVVLVAECPQPDTVYVRFVGIEPNMVLIGTTQFADVRVGQTRQVLVEIRNDGSSDLRIDALPPVAAPFRIVSAVPAPPMTLKPGASTIVTFEYAPTAVGDDSATLELVSTVVGGSCGDTIVIALAGRGIQEALVLDKNQIVFGDVRSCETVVDSVRVTNNGTADVVLLYPGFLNGPDAASFSIILQPLVDDTLKPGESAVYVVQFNGGVANVRVHTAILSVRTSSTRQSQLDVPVSASRISLGLTGPAATDLGTVAVGATTSQIVTFTNTTTTTLNISNVTSGIPVFSITPTTGTVAAGGTIDFTIVFAPQGEGAFAATIWIVTDAPCRDSVMLVTRGVGAAGSISAPNSVYFGTLTDCEQRLDSVTYVNTSVVPVDLIDVNIVGVANQLFTIVNPAAATNVTLPPSGSATVYINFNPRSYADGARTAQLVLRVRLNNQPVPFVTTLTGTRRTSLPSTPVEVAFGSIDIGASSMQLVSVVNSTATPVRITNVFLRNTSFGTISIVPAPVPKTLAPGERFDVQVTYAPVAQQNNVDSIVIAFDQPCQDERVIPVSGTGRLNVEISVILPKHTMDPASDSETLPVKAKVAVGSINLTGGTLHMTMRYTSSVFVVQSISRGTIIRNEVIGGQTFVEIEIANLDATTTESVIFELRGQATIGPIDSTDFVITDAFLDAGFVAPTVRREDGYLKLAVCEEGANPRLIMRGTPMSIRVSPNPVSDNLNIAVDLTEKGIHTVEVITLMGEVVNSMTFKADATGAAFEHDVDTRNIPAGAYQVVLQTPTRRRVTTLSIIH
ncbi:MAG: choice-of-anchor D domain-containing protein [bacterium]|nr:choice-of-anchor D domain-containing protein [bacterium]